uniref:MiniPFDEFa n=1 Tax=Physalis pubescens TaxID=300354 RepID=W8CT00_9SOLA|nr:miniPFDEFa [Physalis pubescens]
MIFSTGKLHEHISPSISTKQLFDLYQKIVGSDLWSSHYEGPNKVESPNSASSFVCEREFSLPCSSPASSLEPSTSGGSCNSLDSYRSLTTDVI